MNIDAAVRYAPVVKKIQSIPVQGSILEVGSGTNGISDFYQGQVIGLDNNFEKTKTVKNSNITHQRGSVSKLPFKSNRFPLTICLDTFEHLPQSKRPLALKELIRVTQKKGLVILGFPTGGLSQKAEKLINDLFRKNHQFDHPWLKEHFEYGLPEQNEIERIIKEQRIKVRKVSKFYNSNLILWLIMHYLFTVNAGKKMSKAASYLEKYLFQLFKVNLPPSYRVIYLISK